MFFMKLSKVFCYTFFILISLSIYSQSEDVFKASTVPSELKDKANAVVRFEKQTVTVEDFDKMLVTTKRIVTIFSKYGNRHQNAVEFYDDNIKIKEIEAKIYDALGNEIKKIKEKDFNDESAVSGGTLYSDSRVKYLSYTPLKYPYTIEYNSEVEMKSTAFVPQWFPIDGFYQAIEYAEFYIINNSDIEIRTKSENFEAYNIEKLGEIHFVAKNLKALKYEAYNPGILNVAPRLKSALTVFNMEGVKGVNNNWEDFGKWMYNNLLTGTDEVPQSVIDEVKQITRNATTDIEKAEIVYKYMQDKTRYISVQVGIGGWKPMDALEVDKLGYSDCKGLTNYTKALLEAVGVTSYYTVVWGDENIKNIDSDFSVTEGNHVILNLPNEDENIFLECTSQTNPFGFIAGFTDDRDVLIVTPQGGKIVHTKAYKADDSRQLTKANVTLDDSGNITATINISTTGYQYNLHEPLVRKTKRDKDLYYKEYWDYLNNLTVQSFTIDNDKQNVELNESIDLSVKNYASKSGKRLILQPNMFNRVKVLPPRYTNRQLDFKFQRAFKDIDEFVITIPNNVSIEAISNPVDINTKFGSYKSKIEKSENNTIIYKREYIMNKGNYDKEDYDDFRAFRKQVTKSDKSKIVFLIQ